MAKTTVGASGWSLTVVLGPPKIVHHQMRHPERKTTTDGGRADDGSLEVAVAEASENPMDEQDSLASSCSLQR